MTSIQININDISSVCGYIRFKYGSISRFCKKHQLKYTIVAAILDKKTSRHKHVKRICSILQIDIEDIQEWKDL